MSSSYVFLCCLLALAASQAQAYSFTSQEVKCHGKSSEERLTCCRISLIEYFQCARRRCRS